MGQPIEDQAAHSVGIDLDTLPVNPVTLSMEESLAGVTHVDMFKAAKHGNLRSQHVPPIGDVSEESSHLLKAQSAFIRAQHAYLREGDLDALLHAQTTFIASQERAIYSIDKSRVAALNESIIMAQIGVLKELDVL